MSDEREFDFDGVLDDADIEYCEHGVNVVCADCRARAATLEAENARLRADLERVTGELASEKSRADKLADALEQLALDWDETRVRRDLAAARRSLEEAVRLLREAKDQYGMPIGLTEEIDDFLASHPTPEPKEPTA